jgi:4-hydroxybenzoyl-CoA thioesterase
VEEYNQPREFHFPIRVYIEDTDTMGIVYYVNYLKYMERGRTELLRSLGYDKPAIIDDGKILVVHSAQINYLRSAKLDEELTVATSFDKLTRTSITFRQRILRVNEVLCDGEIKIACVTLDLMNARDSMKPSAIPVAMCKAIQAYSENSSGALTP